MGKKEKEITQYKVSIAHLVEAWGISRQAIERHVVEGHIPTSMDGQWSWPSINQSLIDYFRRQAQGTGVTVLTDERVRLTKANADRKELELQKERGQLIDANIAIQEFSQVTANLSARMDAMESKLAPVVPIEFHDVLRRIIDEAKHECSNPSFHRSCGAGMGKRNRTGIGTIKTKAAVKRKRVGKRKQNTQP